MEHFAPKAHKNEKGGPDPGNGAAGPDILQNKGFREESFCAKMKVQKEITLLNMSNGEIMLLYSKFCDGTFKIRRN